MSSNNDFVQLLEACIQKNVLDQHGQQYHNEPKGANSNRNKRHPLKLPGINSRTERRLAQSSRADRMTGIKSLGRNVPDKKALDEDLVPFQHFKATVAELPIGDMYEEIVTECESRMKEYLRDHLTLEAWLTLYHTLAEEASVEHPGRKLLRHNVMRVLERFVPYEYTSRVQNPIKKPMGKLVARGTWSLHVEREPEASGVSSTTKLTPSRVPVHARGPERHETRRRQKTGRQYELGEPLPMKLQLKPWKEERALMPSYQPRRPDGEMPATIKPTGKKELVTSANSKVPRTYNEPSCLTPSIPKARIEPRKAHTRYAEATNLTRPSMISTPISKQSNIGLAAKNRTSQLTKAAATPVLSTKRTTKFTKNVAPAKPFSRTIANKTNKGINKVAGRSTGGAKAHKPPAAVQLRAARPALRRP